MLVDGEASNGWDTKSASQVLAGSSSGESDCRNNSVHQKIQSECAVTQGVGEIAYCPSGLMQDPAQLQGQQEVRQRSVLDGCGGEAEEECWDGISRNGGAAACAAANGRPRIILTMSRSREQRIRTERAREKERPGRRAE